ncbi:predicted protein [Lichtheimia corymbifera JMRC:FSU:9682]|uniref:Uncharacterized protein n=1 Tax=Lichtheimia corymbifera JMRC:FSU:9682 TaxID=1263082 RepID=A0A068S8I4_9FUNG|nr:predicted protein [Lichtheimia corymbifera JMRC:FSU:9682]
MVFRFPVTNNKESFCIWKRFLLVRQCNFGHHRLFEFDSQPVSSGQLRGDDDGLLEEHDHRVEAWSFPFEDFFS